MSEIFTFSGTIGRLQFVLLSMAVAVGGTILCASLAVLAASLRAVPPLAILVLAGFLPLGIAFLWVSLALQARRFRDIGWEPLLVIPAWFALQFVDAFAAKAFPEFSIRGHGQTTVLGFALSVTLGLVLLFMPGADDEPAAALPRRNVLR